MRALLLLSLALVAPALTAQPSVSLDGFYGNGGEAGTLSGFGFVTMDVDIDGEDRAVTVARSGVFNQRTVLTRNTADGARDEAFGGGEIVVIDVPTADNFRPEPVLDVSASGEILVAGAFERVEGERPTPYLARFTNTGAPDSTLDGDGVRYVDTPFPAEFNGVAAHRERIYVAGTRIGVNTARSESCFVAALRLDGTLDPSFGQNGVARFNSSECWSKDLMVSDERVLLLAELTVNDSTTTGVVAAFDARGLPLTTFGLGGSRDFDVPGSTVRPTTLTRWGDRLMVGGYWGRDDAIGVYLLALTPTGNLDPTFNDGASTYIERVHGVAQGLRLGVSPAGAGLLVTTSVRVSTHEFGLNGLAFSASGERVFLNGPSGHFYDVHSTDTFRVYEYTSSGSVTDSQGRVLVAASHVASGSSFRRGQLTRLTTTFPIAGEPEVEISAEAYVSPNPSSGSSELVIRNRAQGMVTIRVIDALGRVVQHIHNGVLRTGDHAFRIDASLSPSVYTVLVQTQGRVVSETFTVAR